MVPQAELGNHELFEVNKDPQIEGRTSLGYRVLVVENDKSKRRKIFEFIREQGYFGVGATDGRAALNSINNQPFDLVLLDLNLPDQNGLDVLSIISSKYDLPVIAIGDHENKEAGFKSLQLGAQDFLQLEEVFKFKNLQESIERLIPPTELLYSLNIFEGTYGQERREPFVWSIENEVLSNPNRPHVLGVLGPPSSGKSRVVEQLLKRLLWNHSRIIRFAKRNGFGIRIEDIPWGDPFFVLKKDDEEWQDVSNIRELNKKQVPRASEVWGKGIYHAISSAKSRKKTITFVKFDIPGYTGFRTQRETFGLPRGFDQLGRLIRKGGEYKDLSYSLHLMGVTASTEVQNIGAVNREKIDVVRQEYLKAQTSEERILAEQRTAKLLNDLGYELHLDPSQNIMDLTIEDATPAQIAQIDEETDQFIEEMHQSKMLVLPDFLYRNRKTYRTEIIGRYILPLLFTHWRTNRKKTINLWNKEILPRIRIYQDRPVHHTLRELYPQSWKSGLTRADIF